MFDARPRTILSLVGVFSLGIGDALVNFAVSLDFVLDPD